MIHFSVSMLFFNVNVNSSYSVAETLHQMGIENGIECWVNDVSDDHDDNGGGDDDGPSWPRVTDIPPRHTLKLSGG